MILFAIVTVERQIVGGFRDEQRQHERPPVHVSLAGDPLLKNQQQAQKGIDTHHSPVAGGAGLLLNLPVPLVGILVFLLALLQNFFFIHS